MFLRPYQSAVVAQTLAMLGAGERVLIAAPTGAGKTVIATHGLIAPALANGKRVLVIAHRKELLEQFRDKLPGQRIGVIKAGVKPDADAPLQVASIQSLIRRDLPPADLVIVDEAHHVTADNSYGTVLGEYPHADVVGLSATPYRLDGKGLGRVFDRLAIAADIPALIAEGALVPPRTFAMPKPDLRGVRTVAGDYADDELAERMDTQRIGTALVETYRARADGRSAIAFGVTVAHAEHIAEHFTAAGIPAACVHGGTPASERADILARLADGRLRVVANCAVLTEGFDCPRVSCVILARPTKSRALWRQMVGRGLRPHDGKADCHIHDHAGCRDRHGDVTDAEEFSLDDGVTPKPPVAATRQCLACYAILPGGTPVCTECGHVFPVPVPKPLPTGPAIVLAEVGATAAPVAAVSERERVLSGLITEAAVAGWKPGAVGYKFKSLFGHWPGSPTAIARRVDAERARLAAIPRGKGMATIDALYEAIS